VAVPVEIRVWTKDIGADYLIVRTGGTEEDRAAAEELAVLLDELPLAHDQAAAYCDELEIPFDEYRRRFETRVRVCLGALSCLGRHGRIAGTIREYPPLPEKLPPDRRLTIG
jgi:hypothetical protein